MLERFIKLKKCILNALQDLQLSNYFDEELLPHIESLLNVLKPIKLAIEALSRRDTNLILGECILKFLFKSLREQNTLLSRDFQISLEKRIIERRNVELISLIHTIFTKS